MQDFIIAFTNRFKPAYKNVQWKNRTIVLDNLSITSGRIERCTLIYRGGDLKCVGVTFFECKFKLEGPAATTASFMQAMARDGMPIMEDIFSAEAMAKAGH